MIKVYICHPYGDNPVANEQHIAALCSRIVSKMPEILPLAPQLYLPRFMCEEVPAEREHAMQLCIQIALMCDTIWVCSEPGEESPGMKQEIEACQGVVPLVWMPELRRSLR